MNERQKIEKLRIAIDEAVRFTQRAMIAKQQFEKGHEGDFHSPSFAAAKRSSMDLTRALAELRK